MDSSSPEDDGDWVEIDPSNEAWIMEQVSVVIDGTLRQLREQMKPCEIADVWRRFGPRICDSVELHVRRRASALATAMRESEVDREVRH